MLNPDGTENQSASFIGNVNPIRYRGYYFDKDLGLYWLQTRFYDPEIGRFLSPDSVEYIDPETIGGTNLYAYCNNNPVMNVDPNGTSVLGLLAIMGIGMIVGTVVGAVTAKKAGKSGWGVVKNAILGAAMGIAAGGAIITLGAVGAGAAAALSASTSTVATFLSVPAAQAFAIGALGVNFAAYVITPIYGIKMEGMDKFEVNPVQVDPPRETPLHPAEKRSKRWK